LSRLARKKMQVRVMKKMAEVMVSKALFREILERISHLKTVSIGSG